MAKIQNIGIGKYIRSPKGRHGTDSRQSNVEALFISRNDGNSFVCYPVSGKRGTEAVLDYTRYYQIPIDTEVEQVTI